jgi:exopolysaccharide biosynthesis polyprenyl glycosylphosphotransferase
MAAMKHPGSLNQSVSPAVMTGRDLHVRQSARLALFVRLVLFDALAILIGFSVAGKVRDSAWLMPGGISLIFVVLPVFVILAGNSAAYSPETLTSYAESARRASSAIVQTFLFLFALLFVTQSSEDISRVALATVFVATVLPMLVFRYVSYRWVRNTLGGALLDELVIVDGVQLPGRAARFVIDAGANQLEPNLNDPAMLERFARATSFYDRVLVACPVERQVAWSTLLKTIDAKGELLVERRDDLGVIGIDTFGDSSTLVVSRGSLSLSDRIKKRLFDLALALTALLFLAPLMLVVAICIKLDSRGPVFFKQPRVGRNNLPFQIYKFRSMRQEASDLAGARSTGRNDDRISRFGRFIRQTSIDELPQLINVVKGDMSMVGPRPHALGSTAEDRLFWEISHRYWERHMLKPGITGLAQVRGYRGATEKTSDLTDRLNSDLEYLAGWRLWRDIAILAATLKVLVHPNAY